MINQIKNDILNEKLKPIIMKKVIGDHNDLVLNQGNVLYQITSTFNQINNKYTNISSINLGECENRIRDYYNMDDNEELIIFKIEHYEKELLIPIIEYEIYNINDNIKIDLNICQDSKIELSIPVLINETELFKYDPNSQFYNDKCFPYTTNDQTDMILSDRKNEFNYNNLSVCEKNCEYNGYDFETKKVNCKCNTKIKFGSIKDITINKEKLITKFSFKDIKYSTNLYVIKCYSLLAIRKYMISNIGSYIIIFIFIFFILLYIIFRQIEYDKLISIIRNIINEKIKLEEQNKEENIKNENNKNNNIKETSQEENNINKNEIKNGKNTELDLIKRENMIKRNIKNKRKNIDNNNIDENITSVSNIKIKNSQEFTNSIKAKNINIELNSNNILNQNSKDYIIYNKVNNSNSINNNLNPIQSSSLNDKELNILAYKDALNLDKRTYIQYYASLLRTKHLIIFSCFSWNDYNSLIIKINLFLMNFALYYVVNAFFFNDSTMHKIYMEKGAFNFIYQLPQIIYSCIITAVINNFIKYLSLTENDIIEMKKANVDSTKAKKIERCFNIRFNLFFSFSFIFIILFWYFLACFCAVFTNTQIHLIKDTLISFSISLVYPLLIYLIPGIFRIQSLKRNNMECMYKISKIIQLI